MLGIIVALVVQARIISHRFTSPIGYKRLAGMEGEVNKVKSERIASFALFPLY